MSTVDRDTEKIPLRPPRPDDESHLSPPWEMDESLLFPPRKISATAKGFLPVAHQQLADPAERAPIAWAVGAHGGAGASTLASVIAPIADSGGQWPAYDQHRYCVVVCRSTWTGLDAAHSAVLQSQAGDTGGCEVLGVVIIADAPGRTPKPLVQREKVLEDLTHVWRVPYLPDFRVTAPDKLAVWTPAATTDHERKRGLRKAPATDEVAAAIAELGHEIFQAAFAAHTKNEKDS